MARRRQPNKAVESSPPQRWKGLSGWCVGVDDAMHQDCPVTFKNGDCTCSCHQ